MKNFIEALKKNGGVMMGRYKSNPDICLAEGTVNAILFAAVDVKFKGLLEIDGKNIAVITGNCFKIELGDAEIFLSPSGQDHGEFTAGIANLSLIDEIDLDKVLEGLNITRAK